MRGCGPVIQLRGGIGDHLETLRETGSLKDEALYKDFHQSLQTLGKKINRFIQSVEKEHRTDV